MSRFRHAGGADERGKAGGRPHLKWYCGLSSRLLRQQFAIQDIGDFHLAIRFDDGDVLIYWTTAVGVVHRVGCDCLSVHCAEVIDFSDELSVVVETLHALSFVRLM